MFERMTIKAHPCNQSTKLGDVTSSLQQKKVFFLNYNELHFLHGLALKNFLTNIILDSVLDLQQGGQASQETSQRVQDSERRERKTPVNCPTAAARKEWEK